MVKTRKYTDIDKTQNYHLKMALSCGPNRLDLIVPSFGDFVVPYSEDGERMAAI